MFFEQRWDELVTRDLEAEEAMDGRLAVHEEVGAFLVVRAGDPEDWLARFDKDGEFPAREWAENMANIYNRRLARRSTGPPTPPGTRPAGYHPRM